MEPSPLCRSGKLRTSSYNTHHMASRITTLASHLIEIRSELLTLNNRPPRCSTIWYHRKEVSRSSVQVQQTQQTKGCLLFRRLRIFSGTLALGSPEFFSPIRGFPF